ncbi:MAG: PorV/PorQ family protein [Bacteroidia bacterium]|nr:PorV/PorQ family protein [Bacteroidia bacterium]
MFLRNLSCLLACFLILTSAFGQEDPDPVASGNQTLAPKYSNEFLKIGIGARAFGMGNAQVAIAEDVTAGYWNPAGLTSGSTPLYPEVSLMHASYFANIATYNYGGFSLPVDSAGNRRFGVTLIRLGIDDIPNTLKLIEPDGSINYDKVQSFSNTDFAALFSYAWSPSSIKGLSLGTNVKIIYRGVGRFANAWGFGLDVAARYQIKNFRAGLMVTDVTNTFNAWTFNTETFEDDFIKTGNVVPLNSVELTRPSVRLGLGYDLKLARRLSLLLAVDNDVYFDGNRSGSLLSGGGVSIDPRAGLEFAYLNSQYRKVAFLRGGFYNLQNIKDQNGEDAVGLFPTAGVGIVLKNFQIDYALANIGNLSENLHTHIVSLKFHIQ